jgi:DNA mismatch repair protein MutL
LQESLTYIGFDFEKFTKDAVVFSGIPSNIKESEIASLLDDLVSDIQVEFSADGFSQNDIIAKSMAKSLAIKSGTSLSDIELDNMVNSLFACKDPNISPFNKPTFITITVDDLEKRFSL